MIKFIYYLAHALNILRLHHIYTTLLKLTLKQEPHKRRRMLEQAVFTAIPLRQSLYTCQRERERDEQTDKWFLDATSYLSLVFRCDYTSL